MGPDDFWAPDWSPTHLVGAADGYPTAYCITEGPGDSFQYIAWGTSTSQVIYK